MISMVSSTGTPAARGSGVSSFAVLILRGLLYQVMRFSQRTVYTFYFIHIFMETKIYSCNTFLWVKLCSTRFEYAEYDYEEVECLCCPIMPALSAM